MPEATNIIADAGTHIAHGLEHVAAAAEAGARLSHGPDSMGSIKNFVAIIGLMATLFGAAFGVGGSFLVGQYRIAEIERGSAAETAEQKDQIGKLSAQIGYLKDHGRDEDQRRIIALENQKSGELALLVSEQGRQIVAVNAAIGSLVAVQQQDHDHLTRILTLLEKGNGK